MAPTPRDNLLDCPVDVTEAETLHPLIRSEILNQALPLEAIKTACKQYQVQRPHLFGSALLADSNPNTSDLDLLVKFKLIEPTKIARAYFHWSGSSRQSPARRLIS
jgi:hypothetical protein